MLNLKKKFNVPFTITILNIFHWGLVLFWKLQIWIFFDKMSNKNWTWNFEFEIVQYQIFDFLIVQFWIFSLKFVIFHIINCSVLKDLIDKEVFFQEYLNGNKRSNVIPQSEPESKILHYLVANGWIAANWWPTNLYFASKPTFLCCQLSLKSKMNPRRLSNPANYGTGEKPKTSTHFVKLEYLRILVLAKELL